MLNAGKRVCVVGGTGFVGRHLCNQLAKDGWQVCVPSRSNKIPAALAVLPGMHIIQADVHAPASLQTLFDGCDCVINLVGILNERGDNGQGFYRAHVQLTDKIIAACLQKKVRRYLHMSALQANSAKGPSHYLRTKGMAEERAHHAASADLQVTSFRPSVIFGHDDSFFNRFAKLLRFNRWVFPLACGSARFAPVYVGDVTRAFIHALHDERTIGQRINLCGPKIYTLKQLVEYTATSIGLHTRVIDLGERLSRMQAQLFEFVPGKPFSLDNFRSTFVDSVCSEEEMSACKHTATPLEAIVPYYLSQK
jgi:NADH dehydrogenase